MYRWLTGFIAGVLPVGWLPQLPPPELVTMLLILSLVTVGLRWSGALLVCGICCGCLLAVLHGYRLLEQRLEAACVDEPVRLTGRVSSLPVTTQPRRGMQRQRFEVRVREIIPVHCAGPGTVLLSYYGEQVIEPGQVWRFAARLRRPWGLSNPASHNMQAWFAQTGIDAVGSVRGLRAVAGPHSWRGRHHHLRRRLANRIQSLPLPDASRAFLRALTVGDKSGIDHRLWQGLQRYGINHLMVISGLHVGLVAGAGYLLGALVSRVAASPPGLLRCAAPLTSLVLACCYALLAGFTLPTQRAFWMLTVFALAALCGRRSRPWRSLLIAVALLLALNPLAGLGSGFWLSVGAVAMLLWLSHWSPRRSLWRQSLVTHTFMCLLMLPLGAIFFSGGSLVAAGSNLFLIPLIGVFVVPLALLASLVHMAGAQALDGPLWQAAAWPLSHVLTPLLDVGDRGGSWMYRHLSAGPAAIALALLAVVLWVLPFSVRFRVALVTLFLPLWLPLRAPAGNAGELVVTVLDVGQGTSVVLRGGDRTALYDTGGGDPAGANIAATVVLPYLRSLATGELDTFIISHPDLDHSAGAPEVLAAYPVRRLRYGGVGRVDYAAGRPCLAGEAWQWPGGARFQLLSPAGETQLASNDSSCVLQVEFAGYRLLLPGDVSGPRERQLARYWREALGSEWLLAGHHGSDTSSSWPLLKWVRPRLALVSAGYANRFGHPHAAVLQRVRAVGATVLATADRGAVTLYLRRDAPPRLEYHRQKYQRYWM